MSDILQAALAIVAQRGWPIIPLRPRSKRPAIETGPGHCKASVDPNQIEAWFNDGRTKNLGIRTGNGLVVIDLDGPEEVALARTLDLPPTLQVKTARGFHLYYSVDGLVSSIERQGIELSGEGRYVVAPPSIHPTGSRYVWVNAETAVAALPTAKLAWFQNGAPNGKAKEPKISAELIPSYLRSKRERISDRAAGGCREVTREDLAAVASSLPNPPLPPLKDNWHEWNRAMMAFYADAPDTAFEFAVKWSAKCAAKFHEEDCAERWEHYEKSPPTDIHFGTLVHLCQQADSAFWLPSWGARPATGAVNGAAVATNMLDELNKHHAVISDIGGKCMVMSLDRGTLQTFQSFKERYLNQTLTVGRKQVSLGDAWLKSSGRTQYQGIELDTDCAERRTPKGNLNLWQGYAIPAVAGSWRLLQIHIRDVLASGNGADAWYIVRWIAWAIQNPGKPAEVALVLKGGKGVGKGMFASALVKLFGKHGLQISSSKHLVGNFNAHLRDCILLFSDEAFWAGDKQGESALKRLLTERTLLIEPKHVDPIMWPNRLHVIMAANADWVVPASHDERRYAVFNVTDAHAWDIPYFEMLSAEIENGGLSALLHDLQKMDLNSFHPRMIPHTDALQKQKEESLNSFYDWWLYMLKNDCLIKKAQPESLYREIEHRLKHTSLRKFVALLQENKCVRTREREGTWYIFPELKDAKTAWEIKNGGWKWDDLPSATPSAT